MPLTGEELVEAELEADWLAVVLAGADELAGVERGGVVEAAVVRGWLVRGALLEVPGGVAVLF